MKLNELNKAIDDLNTSASKQADRYQEVGLACLQHLLDSGDIGPCNRLYLGMPKSQRRLAMGTWMLKHAGLKINPAKDTRDTMPFAFNKAKATNMDTATSEKWWDSVKEREVTTEVDIQVAIKQMLNRCKDKTILIGGVRHAPGEAEVALRTMCSLVGLSVGQIKVTDDGKAHIGDATDMPKKPEAEVPPEVKDQVKDMVDAAAKGAADAAQTEKDKVQPEKDPAPVAAKAPAKHAKPTANKAKGGKATAH